MDVFGAVLALFIAIPLIAALSFYLYFRLGESPWFSQVRMGRKNESFTLWKLKTFPTSFCGLVPKNGLPSDLQFLRNWGLDELPQLFHIVQGKLSFVGPRPLPETYQSFLTEAQNLRHRVRPGLIGLGVIMGGNAISWKQRLRWESCYACRQNFLLDCWIIFEFIGTFGRRLDAGLHSQGLGPQA